MRHLLKNNYVIFSDKKKALEIVYHNLIIVLLISHVLVNIKSAAIHNTYILNIDQEMPIGKYIEKITLYPYMRR